MSRYEEGIKLIEESCSNGKDNVLGWVLNPKNAELRVKLRRAFTDWYDQANHSQTTFKSQHLKSLFSYL